MRGSALGECEDVCPELKGCSALGLLNPKPSETLVVVVVVV